MNIFLLKNTFYNISAQTYDPISLVMTLSKYGAREGAAVVKGYLNGQIISY
jgi:hypothetical protein